MAMHSIFYSPGDDLDGEAVPLQMGDLVFSARRATDMALVDIALLGRRFCPGNGKQQCVSLISTGCVFVLAHIQSGACWACPMSEIRRRAPEVDCQAETRMTSY